MIHAIYIAARHKEKQTLVKEAEVVEGAGIVNDRNFSEKKYPGQNVTFIELEEIEGFNKVHGQKISEEATRRNIITKGIRLNEWVGKDFKIGEVCFRGIELCEPCATLGKLLETSTISKTEVVKAFLAKGGLRAEVLSGGRIATGMMIEA